MREIKFRGKSEEKDKWLYGSFYQADNRSFIVDDSFEGGVGESYALLLEAVPESVGEWTGLRDKNSVEIYEGDVVRWEDEILTVVWENDASFTFKLGDNNKDSYNGNLAHTEIIEIIGNIYEHSHLLDMKTEQ